MNLFSDVEPKRRNSQQQIQINKCLNEKRRREQENAYIEELAELITAAPNLEMSSLSIKPDKCAILQETVNQVRRIKQGGAMDQVPPADELQRSEVSSSKPTILGNNILGPLLLEALGGFMFMVNSESKIEFVSTNVVSFLRFTQDDLIDKSIYNFLHVGDHNRFSAIFFPISIGNWSPPSSGENTGGNKGRCINCRFLLKCADDEAGDKYETLQVSAVTLPPPPGDFPEAEVQDRLVCMARRIPHSEDSPAVEVEQFTTKLDLTGNIIKIDTNGISPTYSQYLNKELMGCSILELCHPKDLSKLRQHLNEAIQTGTHTSSFYRFRLGQQDKYVPIQSRTKLFSFNQHTNENEFLMATHSIIKDVEECETPAAPPPNTTAPDNNGYHLDLLSWGSPHDGFSPAPFKEEDSGDRSNSLHSLLSPLSGPDEDRRQNPGSSPNTGDFAADPQGLGQRMKTKREPTEDPSCPGAKRIKPTPLGDPGVQDHLAGQNPMLTMMLSQTVPVPPASVPTSIASTIMTQLPQERLPRDLEKKLLHTPVPASAADMPSASSSDLSEILDQVWSLEDDLQTKKEPYQVIPAVLPDPPPVELEPNVVINKIQLQLMSCDPNMYPAQPQQPPVLQPAPNDLDFLAMQMRNEEQKKRMMQQRMVARQQQQLRLQQQQQQMAAAQAAVVDPAYIDPNPPVQRSMSMPADSRYGYPPQPPPPNMYSGGPPAPYPGPAYPRPGGYHWMPPQQAVPPPMLQQNEYPIQGPASRYGGMMRRPPYRPGPGNMVDGSYMQAGYVAGPRNQRLGPPYSAEVQPQQTGYTGYPMDYLGPDPMPEHTARFNGTRPSPEFLCSPEFMSPTHARPNQVQGACSSLNQDDFDAIGLSLDLEAGRGHPISSPTNPMYCNPALESPHLPQMEDPKQRPDQKKSLLQQLLSEPP